MLVWQQFLVSVLLSHFFVLVSSKLWFNRARLELWVPILSFYVRDDCMPANTGSLLAVLSLKRATKYCSNIVHQKM